MRTHDDFSLDRLRWVFSDKFSNSERSTIIRELKKAADGRLFERRLRDANPSRYAPGPIGDQNLASDIADARARIASIVRFADLGL